MIALRRRSRHLSFAATALAAAAVATPNAGAALTREVEPLALGQQPAFVPGEAVVRFKSGMEHTIEVPPGVGVRAAVRRLEGNPDVAYAAPNYVARIAWVPNDPGRAGTPRGWTQDQWNFLEPPGGVDAPRAWGELRRLGRPGGRRPSGRRGPTVAVVDTGVAYRRLGKRFRRSPDLPQRAFVPGRDFVAGNRLPLDRNGHGTHVASTIAEQVDNLTAVTGLAYGVRIMPVRVLDGGGTGTARDVARGVRWALRHGARVINLSFEFPREGAEAVNGCDDIPGVCRAIRKAIRHRVVIVAAAGNTAASRVAYPAAVSSAKDSKRARGKVIAVGASTVRGCLAEYSNHDAGLDLVAPGGGADADAGPNCEPGRGGPGIVQLTLRPGPAERGNYRRFGYPHFEGTSMATAHVSAAAALIRASGVLRRRQGRRASPGAIERGLKETARLVGPKRYYGAGILDLGAALTR